MKQQKGHICQKHYSPRPIKVGERPYPFCLPSSLFSSLPRPSPPPLPTFVCFYDFPIHEKKTSTGYKLQLTSVGHCEYLPACSVIVVYTRSGTSYSKSMLRLDSKFSTIEKLTCDVLPFSRALSSIAMAMARNGKCKLLVQVVDDGYSG